MPQDDESFLDAVLQPADEVACAKRSAEEAPAPRPVAQKRPVTKPQRIVWHRPQRV